MKREVRKEGGDRTAGGKSEQRRRQADYGPARISMRDLELLEFVGEQYAVTLPQLATLIGRKPETARSLRDRWKKAGWVNSGLLSTQAPSFVWLTRAAVAGSPFRVWQPNHGLAPHIEAVTNTRILLERHLRLGWWECERSIAQQLTLERGHRERPHLPDGILHMPDGQQIAIEVELTLKNRSRLAAIAEQTSTAYDRVWYFARPNLQAPLRRIAADSPWSNIDIRDYPPQPNSFQALQTNPQ